MIKAEFGAKTHLFMSGCYVDLQPMSVILRLSGKRTDHSFTSSQTPLWHLRKKKTEQRGSLSPSLVLVARHLLFLFLQEGARHEK